MFWNYITHIKERIALVVCPFLNNTSFKILKGGSLYRIIFRNLVFYVISYKLYNFLHAADRFSFSTGKIGNPWNPLFKKFRF